MKGALLNSFYENREKPDQRYLNLLIRSGADERHALVEELERVKKYLSKEDRNSGLNFLEQLINNLSEKENPKAKISSRFSNKQFLMGRMMELPDPNIAAAVQRMLREFGEGEGEATDLPMLEALFFCFRRSDAASRDIGLQLLDFLHHPDKVNMRPPQARVDFFILIIRSYFGERESGSYLARIFPGFAGPDNWIDELLQAHKALFLDKSLNVYFPSLHQVFVKLCHHRLKEATVEDKPHGALFKKYPDEVERLSLLYEKMISG